MKKAIWYAARSACQDVFGSEEKFSHIKEVLSLDGLISKSLVTIDRKSMTYWNENVTYGNFQTDFFFSLEYVIENTKGMHPFNLYAVIHEPNEERTDVLNFEFDFVGYELLDKPAFHISLLTNCWPMFDEIHPKDLNRNGILDNYTIARTVQRSLKQNRPNESHTDCDLFEVWRHKTIGRDKIPANG